MTPELPIDVWLEIVANHIRDKRDVSSLASTNRLLRELLLSSLYRRLTFGPYGLTGFETGRAVVNREFDRVAALQRRSHLLRHVREFNINGWFRLVSATAVWTVFSIERLDPEVFCKRYDSMAGAETVRVASSAYDVVTSLIPQLTCLRRLTLRQCTITPQLHSAFCSIPSLDVLSIIDSRITNGALIVDMGHVTLPLREFTFVQKPPMRDGHKSYFTRLLQSCIPSLAYLSISSEQVPQVLAVAGSHRLTIRRLTIFHCEVLPDEGQRAALGPLLTNCPELRHFKCTGTIHLDNPPHHVLPKLTSVSAPATIMRLLVPGRPVHNIQFKHSQAEPVVDDDFGLYASSTVPIRRVGITRECSLPEGMISHMGLSFRHMTHLLMFFEYDEEDVKENIADIVVNSLSQWPQLQVCHLRKESNSGPSVMDLRVTDEEAICPIGNLRDPDNRGHPSLEELSIFSRFTWLWSPREGWTYSNSHERDEFWNDSGPLLCL